MRSHHRSGWLSKDAHLAYLYRTAGTLPVIGEILELVNSAIGRLPNSRMTPRDQGVSGGFLPFMSMMKAARHARAQLRRAKRARSRGFAWKPH